MNILQYTIKIENETFGTILKETFVNQGQFRLFLKLIQGCIELNNDLTFFNGEDFLVHIPHKYLVNSIITTSSDNYNLSNHLMTKSKIEALEIK